MNGSMMNYQQLLKSGMKICKFLCWMYRFVATFLTEKVTNSTLNPGWSWPREQMWSDRVPRPGLRSPWPFCSFPLGRLPSVWTSPSSSLRDKDYMEGDVQLACSVLAWNSHEWISPMPHRTELSMNVEVSLNNHPTKSGSNEWLWFRINTLRVYWQVTIDEL